MTCSNEIQIQGHEYVAIACVCVQDVDYFIMLLIPSVSSQISNIMPSYFDAS